MRFLILGLLVAFATLGSPHVASADSPPAAGDGLIAPDLDAPPPATLDAPSTTPPLPDPTTDPGSYVSAVTALAKAGKWMALVGALLVGIIFVLRRFVFGGVDWFQTNRGGATLAIGTAFLAGFGTALSANLSLATAASAGLAFAMAAVATYVGPKKLATVDPVLGQPPPVPLRSR